MQRISDHQPDIPVNAAAKHMLAGPWRQDRIPPVIHPHGQQVGAGLDLKC